MSIKVVAKVKVTYKVIKEGNVGVKAKIHTHVGAKAKVGVVNVEHAFLRAS